MSPETLRIRVKLVPFGANLAQSIDYRTGRLRLEWVHGYRGNQCRNNLFYTASKELVYFTAAVCVVYNPREHTQRFYHTHTADVISLCLHPGRAVVASGQVGPEPLVCVWDTYSTSTLSLLQGTHQHGVSGLGFSSDGELLVSVGLDQNNTVCVWDWRLGRVLASAAGHTDRIFDVSWSPLQPHRLVTCGVKHIKFWSLIGSLLSYKRGVFGSVAPQTVLSLALKDDITFSGTLSGDVLLWRDTSLIRTVASAHTTVLSLALKDDITFSGTLSGDVLLWRDTSLIRTVASAHMGAVFSLQTSDLQGFVSGGRDGCVRLWDQDFNPINRINLRESAQGYAGLCVRAVCWRGERLVAGSQDGEVFEVLVRERDQPRVLVQGHSAELWGLDTHPKQQVALTGSDDCSIRLWSLQDHRLLSLYKVQSGVRSVAFHPDGSVLALGQKDGSFTVLRLRDMSEVVHIKQSSQVLHELKFSPDAALLAVGCNDGSVHVYATSQRYKRLCTCGGTMESFITHLDWSVDSRVLLTNDGAGTRSFYRMPSGKPVALEDLGGVQWMTWTGVLGSEVNGIWPKYGSEVDAHSAHANPSCALLATAHANGHVRLYRYPCTRKGAKHKRYGGHSAPVTCVRWSSDLQWLLSTGGADHSLFQWRFVPESTMGGALEPLLQELYPDSHSGSSDSDRSDVEELDSELELELQSDYRISCRQEVSQRHLSPREPAPPEGLRLHYVYGFRGWDTRSCLLACPSGVLVSPAASVCVLYHQQSHSQSFYRGHNGDVLCLSLHPSKDLVASGQVGQDATVHVWDVQTQKCVSLLRGHQTGVSSLDFSADGRLLVSSGLDDLHSIILWDWRRGERLAKTRGHKDKVLVVKFNPFRTDKLVSAGSRHIRFWQHSGGGLTSRRGLWGTRRAETLMSLVYGPTEDLVYTGSSSGDVFVWRDTRLTKTIRTHDGPVFCLCPLDQGFVSGGKDGLVQLWDAQFDRCLKSFSIKRSNMTHTSKGLLLEDHPSVRSLALGLGLIFVGTKNGEILEVDKTGVITLLLQGHQGAVWGLDPHPLLSVCASVSDDKTLRIWDLKDHRMTAVRKLKKGGRCVAFSPDGRALAVGLSDGSFLVLNSDSLEDMVGFHHRRAAVSAIRFSPDRGRYLAVASFDSFVDIYCVLTSKRVGVCRGAGGGVTHLDWDCRGKLLRVNTATNQQLFFEAPRGKRQDISQSEFLKLQWASWSCGCPVGVGLQGPLGAGLQEPVGAGLQVNSTSLSSDRSLLATADSDGFIRLYRGPRGGGCCRKYGAHSSNVADVRWANQDAALLSVGGADSTLMMWIRDSTPCRVGPAPDSEESDHDPDQDAGYDSDVNREQRLDFRTKVQTRTRPRPQPQDLGPDQDRVAVSRAAPLPQTLLRTETQRARPVQELVLEHVFGFRGHDCRQNLHYLNTDSEAVFHTARVCVVQTLSSGTQSFYQEHDADILSLTLNRHPKYENVIATGQREENAESPAQIRVWEADSKRTLSVMLCPHGGGVGYISFSATGKLLLSVGVDQQHTLCVWRWTEGSLVTSRGGHPSRIFAAEFRPDSDSLFVSVGVKHIKFWTLVGGALLCKRGQTAAVGGAKSQTTAVGGSKSQTTAVGGAKSQTMLSLAFGADAVTYTGAVSGDVLVWREQLCERVVERAHSGPVFCMFTTLTDGLIVTGAKDRSLDSLKLWDPEMKRCRSFSLDTKKCVTIRSVCRGNGKILVGTQDGDIIEVSEKNSASNVILSGLSAAPQARAGLPPVAAVGTAPSLGVGGVRSLDTHPIREQLVTSGDDATLRLWDLNEKKCMLLVSLAGVGLSVCFSPGGDLLCVGQDQGEVLLLRGMDLHLWGRRRDRCQAIGALRFSPDSRFLAVGFQDSVDLYDLSLGPGLDRVGIVKDLPAPVQSLDWSLDSRLVRVVTSDLQRRVVMAPSGSTANQNERVTWASWSSIVGEEVQGAWPVAGEEVEEAELAEVLTLSASHSGVSLVTGDNRGRVQLCSFPATQVSSRLYSGHSGHVTCVRFSSEDRFVVSSGSSDGSLLLWRCV